MQAILLLGWLVLIVVSLKGAQYLLKRFGEMD